MIFGILISFAGLALGPAWRALFNNAGIVQAYVAGLCLVAAGAWILLRSLLKRSRRRRIARSRTGWADRFAAAWLALLALYLVAECGATAYIVAAGKRGPFMAFRHKELAEDPPLFIPHPFLIYAKNPEYRDEFGKKIINQYGFYGPDWNMDKSPGSLRVACLGGSTTEDGYPEQTRPLLQRALAGRDVEVLDFGVKAWTTAQSLINYELNVRHFHPDYIVLHEGANDFKALGFSALRTDYSQAFLPPTAIPLRPDAPFVRYLNSYALLKWTIFERWHLPPGPTLTEWVLRSPDDLSKAAQQRPKLTAIFRSNIDVELRQAVADGSRVILMTMPFSRTNMDWSAEFPKFMQDANDALRTFAGRPGIVLLDFDKQLENRGNLFIDPVHLNPEGIALKSEAVAKSIADDLTSSSTAKLDPNPSRAIN